MEKGNRTSGTKENHDPLPSGARLPGLVLIHFLDVFHSQLLRWLAVLVTIPSLGQTAAITWGGLCLVAPYLLLMPLAGGLNDRYAKQSLLRICHGLLFAVTGLSLLAMREGLTVFLLMTVLLVGGLNTILSPAKYGSLPEILPTHMLSKANALMGMASIIGLGLGAVCAFGLHPVIFPVTGEGNGTTWGPVILVLAGASLGGLFSSFLVRTGPAADPLRQWSFFPGRNLVLGLKILVIERRLLRAALGVAFFAFLVSLVQLAIIPFGESMPGLGTAETGLLLGLLIAGVGTGSLLAGRWSAGKVELGIVPLGALGIVLGGGLVFLSSLLIDPNVSTKQQIVFWSSSLGLFLLGFGAGLYDVPLETYLQFRSDLQKRGTVLAAANLISCLLVVASFGVFFLFSTVLALSPGTIFLLIGLMAIPVVTYTFQLLPEWTARFMMWLAVHVIYRLKVHGRENIPDQGPTLVVANHVSFMDGVLLCASLSRFARFLVYADFTEMPFLNWCGKIFRVIPIRSDAGPAAVVKSINTAREALKNGEVVCIFAEGGLTRTGQIQPFQRGILKILRGMDVPVIPTYLDGLWGSIFSWRGGKVFWKWPRKWRRPVDIHFGTPISHPQDPAVIRQAVERLGADAVKMDAMQNNMIPARRFVRHCKASKFTSKIADSTRIQLTGGKLLLATLAMRRVLIRSLLGRNEKQVGLLLPPSVGGCLANMALALDGRIAVNLNYTLSDDVLNFCVKKAKLQHVITSRKFLEKKPFDLQGAEFIFLEDVKEKITLVDKVASALAAYLVPASLLETSLGLRKIHADDTLTIVFTSGSTGEPKGVILSNANIGSNVEAIDHLLNLERSDGVLGVLPFFHSFGYTACMWLPLCYNVRGVYHFNPLDAKVVGKLCQEHHLTIMMATPTFLKMYMKRCEPAQFQTVDLIVVGAEKLPVDLAKQFEEKFHILPTEGYGTTELSPVAAVNIPDHRSRTVFQQGTKLGTVGRPLPGVTAKIVDPETGEDRGIGTEGLVLIKGPNVMRGYLDEPEKTNELIHDGWYNTGDFGMLDPDGFLTITGRQSRFSKIGGEMVPHIRIEQELAKICEPPEEEEGKIVLAVTAVPDEDRGERLIVLYSQLCKPVPQIIKELAQTGIPKLWIPSADSFIQVDHIPILGTGKLDLRGIKELALQATCPATAP